MFPIEMENEREREVSGDPGTETQRILEAGVAVCRGVGVRRYR